MVLRLRPGRKALSALFGLFLGAFVGLFTACGGISDLEPQEVLTGPGGRQALRNVLLRLELEGRSEPVFLTTQLETVESLEDESPSVPVPEVKEFVKGLKENGIRDDSGQVWLLSGGVEICEGAESVEDIVCFDFDYSANRLYRTAVRFAHSMKKVFRRTASLFLITEARADDTIRCGTAPWDWFCTGYNPSCGASYNTCHFGNAQQDLAQCQSDLSSCQSGNSDCQSQLSQCNQNLEETSAQLEMCQGRVGELEGHVASLQNQLNEANATIASLTNQLNSANGTISDLQGQLNQANATITDLQNQLAQCESDYATCDEERDCQSRGGAIDYETGECLCLPPLVVGSNGDCITQEQHTTECALGIGVNCPVEVNQAGQN